LMEKTNDPYLKQYLKENADKFGQNWVQVSYIVLSNYRKVGLI
jgi:hypothetical protein